MDPKEFSDLVIESKRAWLSKGKFTKDLTKSEKKIQIFLNDQYLLLKKLKKGEMFNSKNLKVLTPNLGLEPKYYFKVLGKKKKNLIANTPLKIKPHSMKKKNLT